MNKSAVAIDLPFACDQSEIPFVALGEIAEVKLGKMLDRSKQKNGRSLPYLRNINVRWGSVDTSDLLEMFFKDSHEEEKFSVRKGDVLVCEGGEPGRAAVWHLEESDLKYQKALHRVRFHEPYEPKLLVYFLEWAAGRGELEKRFTGSTIKHFTRQAFIQLPVPSPPLPEQRRIVARIEELFSRLDAGVAALRHAKAQLQRYRQSVLAAAVTGQLTQAWREQNPDTEPAEELLERILEQRREQWSGRGKYKEPFPVDHNETVPGSCWPFVNLDMIVEQPQYGTSKKCSYDFQGASVLRIPNVINGAVDANDLKYAEFDESERLKFSMRENDLLMIRSNGSLSIVGRTALVRDQDSHHLYAGYLIRIRPATDLVDGRFLSIALASRPLRTQIEQKAKSTSGVNNINAKEIQTLALPLPPLAEQHQIVAEVESRTTAIDQLEAELDRQITRSNQLRQSTLAAAFSGQF